MFQEKKEQGDIMNLVPVQNGRVLYQDANSEACNYVVQQLKKGNAQ